MVEFLEVVCIYLLRIQASEFKVAIDLVNSQGLQVPRRSENSPQAISQRCGAWLHTIVLRDELCSYPEVRPSISLASSLIDDAIWREAL